MLIEIERKFLIRSEAYKTEATDKVRMVQGFLNTDPCRTVRVRISGDVGYLTVKGKSNNSGTSRFEWEKEIPVQEAENLFQLCEKGTIEKIRYRVESGGHTFEVDEFLGANQGLVIAEIELNDENEKFHRPSWLGEEVTGNLKYYNSQLGKYPFKTW